MATICLIGSARFMQTFFDVDEQLTLMGHVVLTKDPNALAKRVAENSFHADDVELMHLVHLEKIRMADLIVVVDGIPTFHLESSADPYIGESTAREILWASTQGRPMISLMSASGWGNIAETIDARYNEDMFQEHSWLYNHARQVLRTTAGVSQVKELVGETAVHALEELPDPINFTRQHNVMHAMLSIIACSTGTLATMAEVGLQEVGLDPMDDVETVLSGVVPIPDERTVAVSGRLSQAADRSEPMKQLELRRLIGTIIMVKACRDMLVQEKPNRLKRAEVVDKLEMLADTLLGSFGISREEVMAALRPDDSTDDTSAHGEYLVGDDMANR